MPPVAVLDASVLYPLPLRDTLLRAAQVGIYEPCWSERILEEVTRNLVENDAADTASAARMIDAMRGAFDAATVEPFKIANLESKMTNDPKDRHVLAAAVATEAAIVVTLNLRDFPRAACEPHSVEPVHPDKFLLDLYTLDPDAMQLALSLQAAALTRPTMAVADILHRLAPTVPGFARTLHAQSVTDPRDSI